MLHFANNLFLPIMIFVSLIALGNQVFIDFLEPKLKPSPGMINIMLGVLGGALSCVAILYSDSSTSGLVTDYRVIPIIIVAIYISMSAAITAASIISIFVLLQLGFNIGGFGNTVIIFYMAIASGLISRLDIPTWRKVFFSWLSIYSMFIIGLMLMPPPGLIGQPKSLTYIAIAYAVGSNAILAIVCKFMAYIIISNKHYREIRKAAEKDPLTGLNNYRQFRKLLDQAYKKAKGNNGLLTFLFIDIDHFKLINDTFGHRNGDLVLIAIAKILSAFTFPSKIVSRNGGEEFSVILPGCPLFMGIKIGEELREAIEKYDFVLTTGETIHTTVSIGVSSYPETTTGNMMDLIEHADKAMYSAKKAGRNRVKSAAA